ncbi:MAG: phosphotyrosine protein phosphatase [Chthoniobacterales bacterium]
MPERLKVLFVCGRNQRRSPTAEKIFQDDPRIMPRSAGTAKTSRRKITQADLLWADLILVMERKYAARIRAQFEDFELFRPVETLDIPDDYPFMEPELIALLQASLSSALANHGNNSL